MQSLYSSSDTLLKHLQDWADSWESEEESDKKAWTLTAIEYFMNLVKVTAKTEIPSFSEIREEAISDFSHELKETFNQEFPRNFESSRPYFSLEAVRKLVDDLVKETKE